MKNFFRCICILSMMISSEICYFLDFLKVYSCIPEALNSILGSIRFLKSSEKFINENSNVFARKGMAERGDS